MSLDGKVVLITGGTGSFGNAFVERILSTENPKKIVVFSRDEMKHWDMEKKFATWGDKLRFFQGDVRDKERLMRAFSGVDVVIHAAASKIVPYAEYNPFECIKTNIIGAMNVVDAAIERGVRKVVALSTDKACAPANLYGATKLVSDKLFISGNVYSKEDETIFCTVRYGNVMASRGSIIPLFELQGSVGKLTITSEEMTRFMITLEQGVDLVMTALETAVGGEIFVQKIPSMRVVDIAKLMWPNAQAELIGIRPGEKIHEVMITEEDAPFTFEYEDHYRIFPHNSVLNWSRYTDRLGDKVDKNFSYASNTNTHWMTQTQFLAWLEDWRAKQSLAGF